MGTRRRIRILCIDDHTVVREGIARMVGRQSDMHVLASGADGQAAVALYRQHLPDIVLMDLQLPTMSGLEAIRIIRGDDPQARIIVLTMYQGDEDIFRALKLGAATYLLKDALSEDLIGIIRRVHAGERPIPPNIATALATRATLPPLTPREVAVVELISKGMRNKEVAGALGIGEETAKQHVKNVFVKLNVADRTAAIRIAFQRGIIHLDR
jgi:two-component system, NarL family, response regulator